MKKVTYRQVEKQVSLAFALGFLKSLYETRYDEARSAATKLIDTCEVTKDLPIGGHLTFKEGSVSRTSDIKRTYDLDLIVKRLRENEGLLTEFIVNCADLKTDEVTALLGVDVVTEVRIPGSYSFRSNSLFKSIVKSILGQRPWSLVETTLKRFRQRLKLKLAA